MFYARLLFIAEMSHVPNYKNRSNRSIVVPPIVRWKYDKIHANPEKIYNKLKFGKMTQNHVLSHQKKIPMFWTWDFPLFRPLNSAI